MVLAKNTQTQSKPWHKRTDTQTDTQTPTHTTLTSHLKAAALTVTAAAAPDVC